MKVTSPPVVPPVPAPHQVDLTLDDLKEGLIVTKNTVEAAMAPIKQELKDLLGCPVFRFQCHRLFGQNHDKNDPKIQNFLKDI